MKNALGRGLGELLGEIDSAYCSENDMTAVVVEDIKIDLIDPNPNQPRTIFNQEQIEELSESIKEHGLLQPINVTRDGSRYILIAGERRLRATKLANINTIKAIVINVEDSKLAELALIENIQRADLNIIDLAKSYSKLLNEHNLTHDQLSKKISKSRSVITNTLRLLNLNEYVQNKLSDNSITLGHAKVMIGLDDIVQKKITNTIIGQKLSVRETEQIIKNLKKSNKTSKEQSISKFNIDGIDTLVKQLNKNDLKVSIKKNSIEIKFNSQDDIDTILKYFLK